MRIREPFNMWSHLIGGSLFVLGAIALCVANWGNPVAIASFLIFGIGAGFLYAFSAAYHWTPESKGWLQRMDHAGIFIMIAASYTPLCLLALPAPQKWIVLGVQWTLAMGGLAYNLAKGKPPVWVRLVLYLSMGWMALPLLPFLLQTTSVPVVAWMIAGGVTYTVGVFFYASKRPILWPGKFSNHEVWHIFVLGGTLCHYTMMWWLS